MAARKLPRSGLVQPLLHRLFCPDNMIMTEFSGSFASYPLSALEDVLLPLCIFQLCVSATLVSAVYGFVAVYAGQIVERDAKGTEQAYGNGHRGHVLLVVILDPAHGFVRYLGEVGKLAS